MNAALHFPRLLLERLSPPLPLPEPWPQKAFQLKPAWHLGIAFMLNLLSLAVPVMMLQVYDRIIPHKAFGTLVMLIICVSVALVFEACLRAARAWLTAWTAASNEHATTCAGRICSVSAPSPGCANSIAATRSRR